MGETINSADGRTLANEGLAETMNAAMTNPSCTKQFAANAEKIAKFLFGPAAPNPCFAVIVLGQKAAANPALNEIVLGDPIPPSGFPIPDRFKKNSRK